MLTAVVEAAPADRHAAVRASSSESPFYAGERRPGQRHAAPRRRRRGRAARRRRRAASSATTRCSSSSSASTRRSRPATRVRGRRQLERRASRRGEPHGDAPAPRGAARGARRPRQAGGLGRAARQAALRLHAPQPLTPEERERVERIVNEKVFEAIPVRTFVTPIDEARKLGAMMLFGEKYGDEVRVVEIDGFSRELCGGTHVRSTAEIGPFVIHERGLRRLGRAPDRGGDRRRGVDDARRAARASSTACARELERGCGARRRSRRRRQPARTSSGTTAQGERLRGRGEGRARQRAARPLRPLASSEDARAVVARARATTARSHLVVELRQRRVDRRRRRATIVREIGADHRRRRRRPSDARRGRRQERRTPFARRSTARLATELVAALGVKVLALDYGSARTGVAVSDPTGTVARPLTTVERAATDAGFATAARRDRRRRARPGRRRHAADAPRRARRAGARDRRVRRAAARRDRTRRSRPTTSGSPRCSPDGDDARAAAHLLERLPGMAEQPPAEPIRRPRGPSPQQVRRRRIVALVGDRARRRRRDRRRDRRAAARPHDEGRSPPPPPPPKPFRDHLPRGLHARADGRARRRRSRRSPRARSATPVALNRAGVRARDARAPKIPCFTPPQRTNLEGFLFPATYDFLATTTVARSSSADQLETFCKNWNQVEPRVRARKNLTPYDVLIIASMVEKETLAPDERPKVAAVIYNRLHEHMPLGIDATLRYGLHIPPTQVDPPVAARERQPVQLATLHRACRRRRSRTPGSRRSRRRRIPPRSTTSTSCASRTRCTTSSRRATPRSRSTSARTATAAEMHARRPARASGLGARSRRGCRTRPSPRAGSTGTTPPSTWSTSSRRCARCARSGFAGANVTVPHKQAVVEACDEADGAAVNTLVFRDGRVLGSQHRPRDPRRASTRRARA